MTENLSPSYPFAGSVPRLPAPAAGLRIVGAHSLFPGEQYTTDEVLALLQPTIEQTSERLRRVGAPTLDGMFGARFRERLGVHTRALAIEPDAPHRFWQRERNTAPMARAGAACYQSLMAEREPLTADDKLIAVSNAYDTTCPNLVTYILNQLRRNDPEFVRPQQLSLLGEGCSGFISALREADLFLRANPRARVVIIADELTSQYFYSPELLATLLQFVENAETDEARRSYANIVRGLFIQRLLFGDGAVALLCQSGLVTDEGLPFNRYRRWTNLDPEDIDIFGIRGMGTNGPATPPFGYFYQDPKRLFTRLQEAYIPAMAQGLVEAGHRPDAFALHTGSGPILQLVCEGLDIPLSAADLSFSVLREHGNMNTASGAAITAGLLDQPGPTPQHPFLAFFGVGFTAQVAYFQ